MQDDDFDPEHTPRKRAASVGRPRTPKMQTPRSANKYSKVPACWKNLIRLC